MSSKQEDPPEGERGSGGAAPVTRSERSERSEPIRGGQAPGEPAAIALRMEDLTLWALERAAKMPRDHKFTVGDRLVETCLDVNAALVEASFVRDKLGLLHAASRGLIRARVLVRLAERLGLLTARQRGYFASESEALGRQLGGWTRSQRARYPGAAGPSPGPART
jgi:hypothetical protein